MTDINNIPDEKFKKFDNMIQKNQEKKVDKELKVVAIDIQNYKNIDYINTDLGDITVVGGNNGDGKSSFVESIFTAIEGNTFFGKGKINPTQLIKHGENKATIKVHIQGKENIFIIERTFKKATKSEPKGKQVLKATKDGQPIKQKELSELLKIITIDPIGFSNLSIKEQIQDVQNATGLDTSIIDEKINDLFEQRKEDNRFVSDSKSIYEEKIESGIPDEKKKKSVKDLILEREKISELEKKTEEKAKTENKIEELKKDKIDIETEMNIELERVRQLYKSRQENKDVELLNKDAELNIIKDSGKKLYNELIKKYGEYEKFPTIESIDENIKNIETYNEEVIEYDEYVKAKNNLDIAKDEAEKTDNALIKARKEKVELIKNSNLPDYLELSEEKGVLVDGIEFKLLNTAKKIEVIIDLVLISGNPLRIIRIENGGELDIKTLKEISEKIVKAGFQGFFERPIIDEYNSITISNGEILTK